MVSNTSNVFYSLSLCPCQGYHQALLPLTVAGIPSIHICLDFIPELLAQPQLEKQVNPPNLCSFFFLSWLKFATCHKMASKPFSQYTTFFFAFCCHHLFCMCLNRFLQSSCCHTCVPSTPYLSPSVWLGWQLVSWGHSSLVSFCIYTE